MIIISAGAVGAGGTVGAVHAGQSAGDIGIGLDDALRPAWTYSAILVKEVPLAAWMAPCRRPLSSLGRKSCFITIISSTLAARLATKTPKMMRP